MKVELSKAYKDWTMVLNESTGRTVETNLLICFITVLTIAILSPMIFVMIAYSFSIESHKEYKLINYEKHISKKFPLTIDAGWVKNENKKYVKIIEEN